MDFFYLFFVEYGFEFTIFVILIFISLAMYGAYAERRRLRELKKLARRMGFRFCGGAPEELIHEMEYMDLIGQGCGLEAMSGELNDLPIHVFHYHLDKAYHGDKLDFDYPCVVLELPLAFPGIRLRPENIFDKVAGAVGDGDIEFSCDQFSKTYHVMGDLHFAREFFHTGMMDYFMDIKEQYVQLELNGPFLVLAFSKEYKAENVARFIQCAANIYKLMPHVKC